MARSKKEILEEEEDAPEAPEGSDNCPSFGDPDEEDGQCQECAALRGCKAELKRKSKKEEAEEEEDHFNQEEGEDEEEKPKKKTKVKEEEEEKPKEKAKVEEEEEEEEEKPKKKTKKAKEEEEEEEEEDSDEDEGDEDDEDEGDEDDDDDDEEEEEAPKKQVKNIQVEKSVKKTVTSKPEKKEEVSPMATAKKEKVKEVTKPKPRRNATFVPRTPVIEGSHIPQGFEPMVEVAEKLGSFSHKNTASVFVHKGTRVGSFVRGTSNSERCRFIIYRSGDWKIPKEAEFDWEKSANPRHHKEIIVTIPAKVQKKTFKAMLEMIAENVAAYSKKPKVKKVKDEEEKPAKIKKVEKVKKVKKSVEDEDE